jgi:NarL family two-component system response regulator LiaR
MATPIAVLIVDDHAVVREGVRASLEARPDFVVVGEAESGEEAVRRVAETVPDVVLLDLLMEGIDGVETTRQIKRLSPRTQVVILTSFHDDEHIFPALRAGAISYLLKSVKMDELAEAVHRASRGEATLHPRVAARVIQEMQAAKSPRPASGSERESPNPFAELTDRELQVLRLIANGLTNRDIMEQLVISENTVKGHVSNILSKLHLADRTQAAVLAWREGVVRK